MQFTVAIDGPAASGKGTLGRALAEHFGFAYLDTGLLYRAVGAIVSEGTAPRDAALMLSEADLKRGNLRTASAGQEASRVAALPDVREILLQFQRDFAHRDNGAVLDGRDIGTVICPDADVKFFVTASDEERARRRLQDLKVDNPELTHADVLADLQARDARDAARSAAPLRKAEDALLVDTTEMSMDAALQVAVDAVEKRLAPSK